MSVGASRVRLNIGICEGLKPNLIQLGVADNLPIESLRKSKNTWGLEGQV